MSSYNSTSLSVNPLVGLIHNILHLNNKLHPVSNNFALSPSQLWNEYTLSVSVVPLIIGGLGILSILIFISIIIFRNWCHICKCSPGNRYNPDGTTDSKVWVSYELFHNSSLTSYYYISMIWIFVSIQGILVAYVFFILPYSNSAISSTSTLSNQFNVLSNIGITLQNENNTLAKSASYCTDHWTPSQAYSTFQSGLQGYSYFATEYISMIDPFNKKISQASSSMTLYGQTDFTIVIWTIYAACLLALILLQTGLYTSNRRVLLGAIGFSVFFMFCYVIVGAAMMFGLMLLSDYCTSPISNTLSLISPTSSVYPTAQYYLTCLSNNNLQNPFIPIEHDLNSAIMIINSTAKACQLPKIRTDMYASIKSSLAESAQINNNIQCNNISSTVASILEEDICNQIFTGVFIIWVSHFFTLAGLYIALLVTSIICQNYGRFWNFIDGKEVPFQPTADAKKSNKTALASTKSKSGRQDGNPESGADESGAADDADADDSEPADPMDIRISTRRPISTGYGMTGDDEGRYTVKQTMNPNASTLISSMSRNITPKSNPSSPTSGNVMSLASQSNLLTRPMSRSKQVPLNVQSAPDDINGIVYKI